MKKIISIIMVAALLSTFLTACNSKKTTNEAVIIRFLNFKPEVAKVYEEIAKVYKEETGVTLIVETAASGNYEQTLSAKMGTDEAPTLFQINGPKGLANWKDYCTDLSDTDLYKHLIDKSMALTDGGQVYAIPYVVEGYGIIYNEEITDKYFALKDRGTTFKSMDEVNTFDKLKQLTEDMQKNASALGIKGVFASTSLKTGEDWRWHTHLANIPIYYEFKNKNVDLTSDATKKISFDYSDNLKNIFDLYINNSVSDKKTLGSKITDESMAEFALGQCAMVQNGNWAWSQISNVKGNVVKEDKIKFLPIYTGVQGEENQGLCIGTENYFAINANASDNQKRETAKFIYWLFSSEKGKEYVLNKLELIAPFDTFSEKETPNDPLAQEVIRWMNKENVETVPWIFTVFPSLTFKNDFGAALLQYAQGTKQWNDVKQLAVERWEKESNY